MLVAVAIMALIGMLVMPASSYETKARVAVSEASSPLVDAGFAAADCASEDEHGCCHDAAVGCCTPAIATDAPRVAGRAAPDIRLSLTDWAVFGSIPETPKKPPRTST
jgi:hypothetical protein